MGSELATKPDFQLTRKPKEFRKGMLSRIFGRSASTAEKMFEKDVARIYELYNSDYKKPDMTDEQYGSFASAKTAEWKEKIASGELTLEDVKHDAFALTMRASERTLGMTPRKCQIQCGLALHGRKIGKEVKGMIAEMKTGEGKTLAATMPAYLNSLAGKGVHVMTVNDYLAERDAQWMGELYNYMGVTVSCVKRDMDDFQRQQAYDCDIVHGTNEQFGFDYLRDNMKIEMAERVQQRGRFFAIADEADSIKIDEARTPLVISGPTDDRSELYETMDAIIPQLTEEDYEIDLEKNNCIFTEAGYEKVAKMLEPSGLLGGLSLHSLENTTAVHHLNMALRAHLLFKRDRDYIVEDDNVIIVDQSTGRLQPGRRFNEGQHQALEAKEKVTIQPENQTLASITRQNYLRMYDKVSGMTGTALTEADEFMEIYGLDVVEIDPHMPLIREDEDDVIYLTMEQKYKAVIEEIVDTHEKGQPVLVGTASVAKSEYLSAMLKERGIPHRVLNAHHDESEADIIALAGVPGAVTIATNMAGRGTDIKLGGDVDVRIKHEVGDMPEGPEREAKIQEIKESVAQKKVEALILGGLYVIGTERHENRRIDNQLRGRAGRQGEPGRSKFFTSTEDEIITRFAGGLMKKFFQKFGFSEDADVRHPWLSKAIAGAQRKAENFNFEIRKNLLKYDNVLNDQRKVVFQDRDEIMAMDDVSEIVENMRYQVIDKIVENGIPPNSYPEQWKIEEMAGALKQAFKLDLPIGEWAAEEGIAEEELKTRIDEAVDKAHQEREEKMSSGMMRQLEKAVLLQVMDQCWRDHIVALDSLRKVIHFRAYGQRNPIHEYQHEGFTLFKRMQSDITEQVAMYSMQAELQPVEPPKPVTYADKLQSMDEALPEQVFNAFPQPPMEVSPEPSTEIEGAQEEDKAEEQVQAAEKPVKQPPAQQKPPRPS